MHDDKSDEYTGSVDDGTTKAQEEAGPDSKTTMEKRSGSQPWLTRSLPPPEFIPTLHSIVNGVSREQDQDSQENKKVEPYFVGSKD